MNSNSLFASLIKTGSQLINFKIVRRRSLKKPFWLGVARSKRFIVPQPRRIPSAEEKAQNNILYDNYKIELNSLLNFIRKSDPKINDDLSQTNVDESVFEAKVSESLENNDAWNAESARRRDLRIKIAQEKYIEKTYKFLKFQEEKKQKQTEAIENVVRQEKNLSATYITRENLDEAIENCLNKVENFDFAIDLDGNRYPGSETLTSQLNTTKLDTPKRPII